MNKQEERKLVPELRFGDFEGAWERTVLGEEAVFKKGKGISKADISENGTLPCIRYGQLYTHYQEIIDEVISMTSLLANDMVLSEQNDVIIPSSGETAEDIATASCVLNKGIALGGDLNIIRSNINGVFLSYYLSGVKKYDIARLAQGISVTHLYASQLAKLTIDIPELKEQQIIAACLSSLDELISKESEKLDALREHKKGMLQQLFPVEGKTVPQLRFPEFEGDGEWEEHKLSEISKISMGSSPKSSAYNDQSIGLPLLQGNADIKDRYSVPRVYTSQITKECQIGDILLSVRAPVGTVAISKHNACIGRGIAAIRARENYDQEFLFQWLLSYESNWKNISQGGTFDAVNSDDIRSLVVRISFNVKEQQKIANVLSSLDDNTQQQKQKIASLKNHKKGLMQQLFPSPNL